MTVSSDLAHRGAPHTMALEDRFEVLKEIGDGSFGNVVLARVRTAGANIARRGTVVSSSSIRGFHAFLIVTLVLGCHQVDEEDV